MKDCQNDEKLLGMKAAEVILLPNKMLLFMQMWYHLMIFYFLFFVLTVGCLTVWIQPTCIVKAHSWAYSKSLQCKFFSFIEKWPSMEGLTSLNEKCSKVSCHFPSAVTWACETRWNWQKRKEGKQRPFGLVSRAETESLSCPLGVSSRESKNTEKRELQLEVQYEK